jgi:hypothetical protein
VSDTAIALPVPMGSSPGWLAELATIPKALRDATNAHASITLARFDASLFPKQAMLVAHDTIRSLFARGVAEGWSTFWRTFGAKGWHAFSTVISTADGRDALVYEEMHCGGTCGEGAYVWLHRDSPAAPWVIQLRIVSWIS